MLLCLGRLGTIPGRLYRAKSPCILILNGRAMTGFDAKRRRTVKGKQSVEKLFCETGQKDSVCEAREKSMSAGVLARYVGARRLSATKRMSLFQQPVDL
jgi:hypothetical protein